MFEPHIRTMIGVMLIFFGIGFLGDWGIYSIYVLSYYHFHGAPVQIKASTNSLMMGILTIPVGVCLIIATKVAARFGYERCIRVCAIQFLLVPLICFFNFSFVVFMIFGLLIPLSGFALSLIPMFHCMYSHFGQSKSMATGAAIFSFGIGSIFWNFIITMAINPDNTIPDIQTQDPNLNFFPRQLADKIPTTLCFVNLISGILFVIGSFLITLNKDYKDNHANRIDLNFQPETTQLQHYAHEQLQQGQRQIQQQQPLSTGRSQIPQTAPNINQQPIDIIKYLKHPITIMLFIFNMTACIYQVYFQLNTKLIYMSILQDDHLISIGLVLNILSSAVCSIFWGTLADCKGPPLTIIVFIILDFAAKIFTSIYKSRTGFIVSSILLGATDKTMLILFAPILIDCFGLRVGSQLLPFKGLSGLLSVILTIILGYIFASISTPDTALYCLCIFSIFNLGFGICLANAVSKQQNKRVQNKESIL